ncbi:NAD-P-binding protein [Mycena amicta]|nr:NAD-P-binding protein [Mycena amicta]
MYPQFTFETTAEEVATAFASEIVGKNVLITGTSLNGIGFEAARVIAKYANLVIITGYNEERLKLSEAEIKKDLPPATIRRLTLDLSSLASVRKAAAEVSEPIHVLIHNAAAPLGPLKLTVDGLESQFATDHVGPFLLTKLLLPNLLRAATGGYTPRVVFVSSAAHAIGTAPGVDLDFLKAPNLNMYTPHDVYYQAKSAMVLTASELSRRAESKGTIHGYSLHPGIILTNITQRSDSIPAMQAMEIFGPDGKPLTNATDGIPWKTIPQGAATIIAAAFDPRIATTPGPGGYLNDCVLANDRVAPHASDPKMAEKLWAATEEIIGEKWEF